MLSNTCQLTNFSPATYGIFRQGVLSGNRDRMAQNIANFIVSEGLDGVDIDWEYPAAPDLPDIPTADTEEGENYYLFLQKLRSILPSDKSVSFAAPASFWYLRGFPIAKIINVVDYVVYMTYDLHGQVCGFNLARLISFLETNFELVGLWQQMDRFGLPWRKLSTFSP